MNVVSKSEASRMAGVSRQAIQDLKKINTANKKKYPFFVFDPDNGKPGVNVDHKDWIDYLNRNQSIRVKKNPEKKQLKRKDITPVETGSVNQKRILDAVVKALDETYEMTNDERNDLLELIGKYYEEG